MKTPILLLSVVFFMVFASCQSNDKKDESQPYQGYDTTAAVEKLNTTNPDSIKSTSSSNDDIH